VILQKAKDLGLNAHLYGREQFGDLSRRGGIESRLAEKYLLEDHHRIRWRMLNWGVPGGKSKWSSRGLRRDQDVIMKIFACSDFVLAWVGR